MKRVLLATGVVWGVAACGALAQTPLQVRNVIYEQDMRTHRVKVDYTLESNGEAAFVRLDILTNGVSIGMEKIKTVSGDFSRNFSTFVEPGNRHLEWSARSDWYGHLESNAVAVVYAWPTNGLYTVPGSYMVIDISGGSSATAYPVSFTFDSPDPAVNANLSDKLWLKYCPPGTYLMGSPTTEIGRNNNEDQHSVTLTQPFFAGVFQVTRAQYQKVVGSLPSNVAGANDYCPVNRVSWNDLRGNGVVWPASNDVAETTFFGLLRKKTGIDSFDLPTDAQFEYAARAGETASYNNGFFMTKACPYSGVNNHGAYTHPEIAEIAWVRPESNATMAPIRVGSKKENRWGLYDMAGNTYEWCLDFYQANLGTAAVTNPVGPATGTYIVARSAGVGGDCKTARSAARRGDKNKTLQDGGFGFRVFCTVR
ncbi:MAG: formylglycine-generating enzyme family protein [Kiritimatiellae bacterium]|nr:formylglycine-generating enzyme family protein [Kiritimatiellia bacterium]